jgi:hypothetical protein
MIDSGSDVVTVREDVLETLDLELLGQIHSKGVHGSGHIQNTFVRSCRCLKLIMKFVHATI